MGSSPFLCFVTCRPRSSRIDSVMQYPRSTKMSMAVPKPWPSTRAPTCSRVVRGRFSPTRAVSPSVPIHTTSAVSATGLYLVGCSRVSYSNNPLYIDTQLLLVDVSVSIFPSTPPPAGDVAYQQQSSIHAIPYALSAVKSLPPSTSHAPPPRAGTLSPEPTNNLPPPVDSPLSPSKSATPSLQGQCR